MKSLKDFRARGVRVVLTDIDGTLTEHGRLPAHSYAALSALTSAGIHVIPVTGRPAGWCELIARLWPVHGVVGENGAFYFRHDGGKMRRHFVRSKEQRRVDRLRLREVRSEVLQTVPGSAIASDQFCRMFDLAIDFCEDVAPLRKDQVAAIVEVFHKYGATAKVSNIHVNGWFGDYDKVSTCKSYLKREFGFSPEEMRNSCVFVGDSPNDEPMFAYFPHSFAVANIREFVSSLKNKPAYVAISDEGRGFEEIARHLLAARP